MLTEGAVVPEAAFDMDAIQHAWIDWHASASHRPLNGPPPSLPPLSTPPLGDPSASVTPGTGTRAEAVGGAGGGQVLGQGKGSRCEVEREEEDGYGEGFKGGGSGQEAQQKQQSLSIVVCGVQGSHNFRVRHLFTTQPPSPTAAALPPPLACMHNPVKVSPHIFSLQRIDHSPIPSHDCPFKTPTLWVQREFLPN